MKIIDLKQYQFDKNLIIKKKGATIMAYNPSNGDMYEMNEISIGLIEKLIENKNGYTILREFCEEYKVEENVIIEDLSPLLERLVKLELLKVFD